MITKKSLKNDTLLKEAILKDIKVPNKSAINKNKRADILLDISKSKSKCNISRDENIARNTVISIAKDNKELLSKIERKSIEIELEQEERIILSALRLLEKKLNNLNNNNKKLNDTRLTELSAMIKDIFNKVQIQRGQPTAISQQINNIEEAKLKLLRTAKLIEGDSIELLEAVFKDD